MQDVIVQNITKTFDKGNVKSLNNISFSVEKGELFGLIGSDGAGKTTLFRILTTLLLADSGQASVNASDVVIDFKEIRSKVGYMPGKFSLYQDLSVEENLNFFASIFNTTVAENYNLIKEIYVQLEPFKARKAGKLSGGMKQKLALCCALIHRPAVLFLDEPTTGVDAVSRKEFWEMLKRLKKEGITILVSTPYMDEANLCERIALMQKGEILSIDTPQKITEQYPDELFAIKSDNMSLLLNDLRKNESVKSAYSFGEYHHISFRNQFKDKPLNAVFLGTNSHTNIEIKSIAPTVEDCFIHLMSKEKIMKAETVIKTENLCKKFGDFIAVDNISFEVYKGEIFGFLGANGAGKTTAMRMLCGLSTPSSGKANIAGFDVYKQTEKIKSNIGYMSQKFSLYEDLTIAENINFFGGIYGLSDAELKEQSNLLIDSLGLRKNANKLVGELPLGWKQKLAFSVAIIHKPSIVFLDEPTGGVDPITRRQFWDLIYQAAEDGITIFVTTHYMDEAEYCNRVSMMVDGKIAALDSPANLKKKYGAETMDEVFFHLARQAKRS